MNKCKSAPQALSGPLIGMIDDFDAFFRKLEKRREELDALRDELLIYGDPEFLESIRKADEETKEGKLTSCKNALEVKKLFASL